MKFKKIVAFGDSWVWGDELLDPALVCDPNVNTALFSNNQYRERNCFLGLLGEHYQVPTENFGIAGGSLQTTIWNYIWWRAHETVPLSDCLILIGLTGAHRLSWYNPKHEVCNNDPEWNRYVHSTWIHTNCYSNEWQGLIKQTTVLADCQQSHQLNYIQTMDYFAGQQGLEITAGIIQFNTLDAPCQYTTTNLIWPDSCLRNLLNTQPNKLELLASQGHPSEQGHQLIAQHLIFHIDSCII
jgi:hypothetical protein